MSPIKPISPISPIKAREGADIAVSSLSLLVPRTGLEPARLAARAPETRASTIPPPGREKRDSMLRHLEPRFERKTRLDALQHLESVFARAENETRTRDPDLGKVVLYQLSYFRLTLCVKRRRLELPRLAALPPQSSASTNSATSPTCVSYSLNLLLIREPQMLFLRIAVQRYSFFRNLQNILSLFSTFPAFFFFSP